MHLDIHVKLAQQEKKSLQKAQAIHLFQSISCSRAMHWTKWTLQSVKCLDKLVGQDDGRKSRAQKQNSKKGFEKNEHASSVDSQWGSC